MFVFSFIVTDHARGRSIETKYLYRPAWGIDALMP